jgi:hypothetical protein
VVPEVDFLRKIVPNISVVFYGVSRSRIFDGSRNTMRCGNKIRECDKPIELSSYAITTGLVEASSSARFMNFGGIRSTISQGPSREFIALMSIMTSSKIVEEAWYAPI